MNIEQQYVKQVATTVFSLLPGIEHEIQTSKRYGLLSRHRSQNPHQGKEKLSKTPQDKPPCNPQPPVIRFLLPTLPQNVTYTLPHATAISPFSVASPMHLRPSLDVALTPAQLGID